MADKNKSEIFQKITTQQDIKDNLNQSNSTFKNKKGRKKERHGGLTFKFNKINTTNNQLTDVIINDNPSKSHIENPETVSIISTNSENIQETNNDIWTVWTKFKNYVISPASTSISNTEEISQTQSIIQKLTKENQQLKNKIQSLNQEKQNNINFDNFKYNAVTILDEYKDILFWKNQLQDQKKEKQELKQQQENIKKEILKKRKLIEELEKLKNNNLKENKNITREQIRRQSIWEEEKIQLEAEIYKKEKQLEQQWPTMWLSKGLPVSHTVGLNKDIENKNIEINKTINKKEKEIEKNRINNLNKINKKEKEIEKLNDKINKTTSLRKKINFDKKILKIKKEIKNIKNKDLKKIKNIHEEILPINNKIYFKSTLQHIDNSITEKIMHFQQLTNGDIQVINQIKSYENINKYKKDTVIIEDILSINNNTNCQFIPIKDFLNNQKNIKIKPSWKDGSIWIFFTTLSIGLSKIPYVGFILGPILKVFSSIFSYSTKKVESWVSNKMYENKHEKEKNKKIIWNNN